MQQIRFFFFAAPRYLDVVKLMEFNIYIIFVVRHSANAFTMSTGEFLSKLRIGSIHPFNRMHTKNHAQKCARAMMPSQYEHDQML